MDYKREYIKIVICNDIRDIILNQYIIPDTGEYWISGTPLVVVC